MSADPKIYAAEFEKVASSLPGAGTPWVADWRAVSLQRFTSLGFPTSKHEAWKYTSVALLGEKAKILPPPATAKVDSQVEGSHLVVFVNGRFEPGLSRLAALPKGVSVRSIAKVLEEDPDASRSWLRHTDDTRAFSALNGAFLQDGAWIEIPAGTRVEAPIEILWVGEKAGGSLLSERLWVEAGASAEVTLVERFQGQGDYWRNALAEVRVGENAKVLHVVCQTEGPEAIHFRQVRSVLQRASRYESHQLSFGGSSARDEIEVRFEGEGGEAILNGLFVGAGKQHLDNRTFIDHAVPHCRSEELYKGVLGGEATGVFDGKVLVRREAQKTDSSQTNKNLLLSRDAEINTKPTLEIYADDVKCAHGATTGQLDPNSLFYLRARGIGKPEAERLLTRAFAHEVLDAVPVKGIAPVLDGWLEARLEKA